MKALSTGLTHPGANGLLSGETLKQKAPENMKEVHS
jgi:hypothetical protein